MLCPAKLQGPRIFNPMFQAAYHLGPRPLSLQLIWSLENGTIPVWWTVGRPTVEVYLHEEPRDHRERIYSKRREKGVTELE